MGYVKKTWQDGEIITSEKLNNHEEGIQYAMKQAEDAKRYATGGVLAYNDLADRPLGSEYIDGYLFSESITFLAATGSEHKITDPLPGALIVGKEYNLGTITQNHICKAQKIVLEGVVYTAVGNLSILGVGNNTGESIVVIVPSADKGAELGWYAKVKALPGTTTVMNISLSGMYEIISRIEKKYMPADSYGEEIVDGYHLPRQTVTFDENGEYKITQPLHAPLTIGDKYTIRWNGLLYSGPATETDLLGSPMVGVVSTNKAAFIQYPADMATQSGVYAVLKALDGSTEMETSVYGAMRIVKKLDKKFLPDDIPTSGGGSGGVSSWNDLTDKPFGTVEKEGYTIPETTVAITEGQGALMSPPVAPLVGSRTYTVNWNGTSYNCTSFEMEEGGITAYILGNMAALGGDDTGEPFIIMAFNEHPEGVGAMIIDMTGGESATLSVYGMGQFIETLGEKYIPENIPRVVFIDAEVNLAMTAADVTPNSYAIIKQAIGAGNIVYVRYGIKGAPEKALFQFSSIAEDVAVFQSWQNVSDYNNTAQLMILTIDTNDTLHGYMGEKMPISKIF